MKRLEPRPEARAGSLGIMGPGVSRQPQVGKRKTSRRRRHMTYVQKASSLASAAGGNPIDRHMPYVYGASSMRARMQVVKAYIDLLEKSAD